MACFTAYMQQTEEQYALAHLFSSLEPTHWSQAIFGMGVMLFVRGQAKMPPKRTCGGKYPLKPHGRDDIRMLGIAQVIQGRRIKGIKSRGHDDGAHMDGQLFFGILVINGARRANFFAEPALVFIQIDALGVVNGVFQRHGLGVWHIDGLSFSQVLIIGVIYLSRAFFSAEPAGNTFIRVHIPGVLGNGDLEISLGA